MTINEFVAENKTIFSRALKECSEKLNREEILVSYSKICSSSPEGNREGYFYNINDEEHFSENIEGVKEELSKYGYSVESTGWHFATFINGEIAKQNKIIEEENNSIINARREIKSKAREFMMKNFNTYIRFGAIPESGKSRNYRDGYSEAGVSVYDAIEFDGEYFIDVVGSIFTFGGLKDKNCYIVKGELLEEKGSDGEPLLQNAKIVRKIDNEKVGLVGDFINKIFAN